MEQIRKKLKSARGESLVELLASILIGGLSITLLVTMILTSARMNKSVQKTDEEYYKNLEHAEAQDVPMDGAGAGAGTGNASVSCDGFAGTVSIPVDYFGGEGVVSYKTRPSAGGGGAS